MEEQEDWQLKVLNTVLGADSRSNVLKISSKVKSEISRDEYKQLI